MNTQPEADFTRPPLSAWLIMAILVLTMIFIWTYPHGAPTGQDAADVTTNTPEIGAPLSLPDDEQSELIDQPTITFGAVGASAPNAKGEYNDPHDDPRWHHTRREVAKAIPRCEVPGCTDPPAGDAIHHGISAKYCVKAGHYELAVEPGPGQRFYRLCEKHHGPLGHGIGYGGSWGQFNVDVAADVKAGKWNSRGKSKWPFETDAAAANWVRQLVKSSKTTQGI